MIKEQVFVYMPCMNVCKQLYVDIDIAKNMRGFIQFQRG